MGRTGISVNCWNSTEELNWLKTSQKSDLPALLQQGLAQQIYRVTCTHRYNLFLFSRQKTYGLQNSFLPILGFGRSDITDFLHIPISSLYFLSLPLHSTYRFQQKIMLLLFNFLSIKSPGASMYQSFIPVACPRWQHVWFSGSDLAVLPPPVLRTYPDCRE